MVDNKDIYIDKLVRISLILAIVAWTFQLLYPLLDILAWGFILTVIMHPAYTWLNNTIGNRPLLAATSVTLGLLLLVFSITVLITNDVAHTLSDVSSRIRLNQQILPPPSPTIQNWPLIGKPLYETLNLSSTDLQAEINKYSNTLLNAGKYVFVKLTHTTKNFLLFTLSILFSGFLLVYSVNLAEIMNKFAKRVSKQNGIKIVNMIKETIHSVSKGIIGIALLQTLIFWILLLIADVPGAGLLSLLGLIFSIAQVGLIILIVPVIIWLFFAKSFALALTISILLILDTLLDSFLKPIVLAHGLSTHMLIIFIGVISGILVYGLIGIFIGPVVLAIACNLLQQWIEAT